MFQVLIWAFQLSIVFGLFISIMMLITKAGSIGINGLTQACIIITPSSTPKTKQQLEDEEFDRFIEQLEKK